MIQTQKDDLFQIQVRVFRTFQLKWDLDFAECSELFNKYDIYNYIETCYEIFHTQGDDASVADIEKYLQNNGYKI